MDSTDSSQSNSTPVQNSANLKEQLSSYSDEKLYEYFAQTAWNLREVVDSFEVIKERYGLTKKQGLELYRGLRATLGCQGAKTWKARDVLNMLEKRANQKEYAQQKAATGVRVLIVGAGPVGLRLAIDCILLGAEVVVIEKRNSFSRNNVLHLWPFTIEDLRQLGAKKFYGKFCAGAIDHISIRSLQCILLKVALLLGLRFYSEIEFLEVQEPEQQIGWHAKLNPSDHPLNLFEFDVLVGADGARKSSVPGFDRKELRGKLALAITANFKNTFTREEVAVQEISGVAFIFNQKFFKDLKEDTDIDLENIVYYKDDTHYFVMTAKKDSLLRKGVLLADYPDTMQLLNRNNIHMENLYEYAREAAGWSTELPKLDFAVNHYNKNDVALFDFTSIHQAEYAAQAINRAGKDLYICLVGDSLLEPFWPTGTGCGRGFLSAMDTAWMIKRIGQKKHVLDILCEREGIFQRLPQTTPETLTPSIRAYTIDPKSRYPNLHLHKIKPNHVAHLYDTDETCPSPALRHGSIKVKRSAEAAGMSTPAEPVVKEVPEPVSVGRGGAGAADKENTTPIPSEKKRRQEEPELPPPLIITSSPRKKSLRSRGSTHLAYYAEPEEMRSLKDPTVLLHWLQQQVKGHGIKVKDLTSSWSDGLALCALIYHYHPELIPEFKSRSAKNYIENNERAFSIAEEHLGISRLLKPEEMKRPDKLTLLSYLSLFYELFLDTEPALPPSDEEGAEPMVTESIPIVTTPTGKDKGVAGTPEGSVKKKKRRSLFRRPSKRKLLGASPSSADRSWNTKSVKRDGTPTSPPVSKVSPLAGGAQLSTIQEKQPSATTPKLNRTKPPTTLGFKPPEVNSSDFCYFCNKRVYLMERMSANGFFFHRNCFKCSHCNCQLKIGGYSLSKGAGGEKGKFFCSPHYRQLFLSNPEAINYSRAGAGSGGGGGVSDNHPSQAVEVAKVQEPASSSASKGSPAGRKQAPPPPSGTPSKKSSAGKKQSTPSPSGTPSKASPVDKKLAMSPPPSTDDDVPMSSEDSSASVGKSTPKKKKSMRERLKTWSKGQKPQSRSRSSSAEPELDVKSSTDDEHREIAQLSPTPATVTMTTGSSPQSSGEEKENRGRSNSMVARLSMGFEQLEANARDTEIQLGREGRERAKSQLIRNQSGPSLQPFQVKDSLGVIDEIGVAVGGIEQRPPRPRSPARWRGSLQQSRLHIEDVTSIKRSSQSIGRRPVRKGRGQRSISRPLIDNYDSSDVAIQERRKQQRRFRDAQLIQREMSQLERQYDELEEVGRDIEQALRDAGEDTKHEEALMKSWLGLVNERNGLVRKTSELSLRMKELELEDRQYEVDKKLSALSNLPEGYELGEDEIAQFDDLCAQKIKIVEERDELVNQTEEERLRELEEDGITQDMMNDKFLLGRRSSDESDEEFEHIEGAVNGKAISRHGSLPSTRTQKVDIAGKENRRKSWWPSFGKS